MNKSDKRLLKIGAIVALISTLVAFGLFISYASPHVEPEYKANLYGLFSLFFFLTIFLPVLFSIIIGINKKMFWIIPFVVLLVNAVEGLVLFGLPFLRDYTVDADGSAAAFLLFIGVILMNLAITIIFSIDLYFKHKKRRLK
ncbi:hypothetical protein HZA33_04910 [Candidatus Pacearchaeota archaeon]|nr:hypothetical protein [Candidatus Pacearchaeota archaeon]